MIAVHLFRLLLGFSLTTATATIIKDKGRVSNGTILFDALPQEICDEVFVKLDIGDYAAYLKISGPAMIRVASYSAAFTILKRGAKELDSLDLSVRGALDRAKRIFSSLQTVIRVHCKVGAKWEGPIEDLGSVAQQLEKRFDECAALSRKALWRGSCMIGIVSTERLMLLLPSLSSRFLERNRVSILLAATGAGLLDLVDALITDCNLGSQKVLGAIAFGIAFHGSMPFFEQVTIRLPLISKYLPDILASALIWNRKCFFNHMFQSALQGTDEFGRKKIIGKTFASACSLGRVGVLRKFLNLYSSTLTKNDFTIGLRNAEVNSHFQIIKLLVWDGENNGVRSIIDDDHLKDLLLSAARYNRIDVIDFLLFDLGGQHLEALKVHIVGALSIVASKGFLRAMDRLLSRDIDGNFFIPVLEFSGSNVSILKDAVYLGRPDVLEYLVARKDNGAELADDRFDGLDMSSEDNLILRMTCEKGYLEILRFLLQTNERSEFIFPGIDSGCQLTNCLQLACRNGFFGIVKELLQTDDDTGELLYPTVRPWVSNNLPLRLAALNGCIDIVQFLLQRRHGAYKFEGIDPTADDQGALRNAATSGNIEVVKCLLSEGSMYGVHSGVTVPNDLPSTVAQNGFPAIEELLLQHQRAQRNRPIAMLLSDDSSFENLEASNDFSSYS